MGKIIYESILWALLIGALFTIFVAKPACADGIDNGKGFYGKDVIVYPDEIDEWSYYQGIWMKKLPRVHLPNGHFMLDPRNMNYWRDFDNWPCYYPIWHSDGGKCINPGDEHRHYYVGELREEKGRDVPEPEMAGMLGIGLLVLGAISKVRGKL